MVLANTLTRFTCSYLLIAIAFVLSLLSCRSTKPVLVTNTTRDSTQKVEPSRVEVASYRVQISVREGKCVLTYDGPQKGEVETDLSGPCEFSRGHTGTI